MALDVSAINSLASAINADAQALSAYIAANPNTSAQDQAALNSAAQNAATAFAGLHNQIQTLTNPGIGPGPSTTLAAGAGADTLPQQA